MAEPALLDTDRGAKRALAAVSTAALEAAAQGAGSGGEGASAGVPAVQDRSRMGERLSHKGNALMGHGIRGMYGSLPAQELLQQLQQKAPVTRNFLPEQRSYGSQHPASMVTSLST